MSYSESHISHKVAEDYDNRFAWLPLKNQQKGELRILKYVIKGVKPSLVVDLACGTGRILKMVEEIVQTVNVQIIGIDNSSEMLSMVAKKGSNAKLITADILKDETQLNPKADLITCFRLVANAEPHLRAAAFDFAFRNLKPGGYLLINNHKNHSSLSYRILRHKNKKLILGVRDDEIFNDAFLKQFEIIKLWSIGIVPHHEFKYFIFGKLSAIVDHLLLNVTTGRLGINNIYLFRKKP